MFDFLGWEAEYEPFDLDGWIPDFAITSPLVLTLVEVKPISDIDEFTGQAKIIRALKGTEFERASILICGYRLPSPIYTWNHDEYRGVCAVLGWGGRVHWTGYRGERKRALAFQREAICRVKFGHPLWPVQPGAIVDEEDVENLHALWEQAGNATQWKSPVGINHQESISNPWRPLGSNSDDGMNLVV